jgi:hypothetical protein
MDTSKDGLEYVGIHLSDKQFNDLGLLSMLTASGQRKSDAIFDTLLVLKVIGLLPSEMIDKESDEQTDSDINDYIQKKFGRIMEQPKRKRRLFGRRKS